VWVAAWATVGGAVATAATGTFIVAQTIATRRSVEISQAVEVQSAKARLDARAPRLNLTIGPVRWPPHRPASHDVTVARGGSVAWDEEFRLPRDGRQRLVLEATGRLHNDGERTVTVEVIQPLMPWPRELDLPDQPGTAILSQRELREEQRKAEQRMRLQTAPSTKVTLDRGVTEHLRLRQEVSVADLAAASTDGKPVSLPVVELVVDDGFDEGLLDTHRFALVGHAMTRAFEDGAGFTITATNLQGQVPMYASSVVVTRRYFFSKSTGQEMPTAATAARTSWLRRRTSSPGTP
jgi:hypothetical protein